MTTPDMRAMLLLWASHFTEMNRSGAIDSKHSLDALSLALAHADAAQGAIQMTGHGHSRGQQIDAIGTLERGAYGPVLVLDGGGRWRLETSWRARKWIGKRVRVVGRRVEFDLIEVDRISAADGA